MCTWPPGSNWLGFNGVLLDLEKFSSKSKGKFAMASHGSTASKVEPLCLDTQISGIDLWLCIHCWFFLYCRPSHTQPSIGGENREEALQGSQSIHPTKRKLSTELTNNYLASMRPPNTYTSGRNVRREGEAGNHGSVRRRLGPEKWTEMRSILGQQRQQFQQQVNKHF